MIHRVISITNHTKPPPHFTGEACFEIQYLLHGLLRHLRSSEYFRAFVALATSEVKK